MRPPFASQTPHHGTIAGRSRIAGRVESRVVGPTATSTISIGIVVACASSCVVTNNQHSAFLNSIAHQHEYIHPPGGVHASDIVRASLLAASSYVVYLLQSPQPLEALHAVHAE